MEINKLKQYGLTDREALTYVAVLELGEATIQSISNKTKIKRSTVYEVIDSLMDKGIISFRNRKKRKYFTGIDPRDLIFKMDERKNAVASIIPQLLSVTNLLEKKPKISFYEGEEGIKAIYLDTLKDRDHHIYAWVSDDVWKYINNQFISDYVSLRAKSKIFAFVIAQNTKKIVQEYKPIDKISFRKTIVDSDPLFHVDAEIDLYGGNKVGIMIFGEKIGFVIESSRLYNTLRSIFNIHWNSLGGGEI